MFNLTDLPDNEEDADDGDSGGVLDLPSFASIHYSVTPILQVLLISSFEKERMTAVYQQL